MWSCATGMDLWCSVRVRVRGVLWCNVVLCPRYALDGRGFD